MPSFLQWQLVHKWLAVNRKQITLVFQAIEWSIVIATVGAFFLFQSDPSWWLALDKLARKAATVSATLYLITLVPGMLKRFGLLPLFTASLMLFRRQFGVTMFLLGIAHLTVMGVYPRLTSTGLDLSFFSQHEIYGLLALTLLFPLWITSNDTSKQKLGPWWKWVHRLTYIALLFIYLHVAAVSETLRLAFIVVMTLEAISWVYYWISTFAKKKNVVPPTQVPQS